METKDGILNNVLCMGCLCIGRILREVEDERHKKFYMDALNELPLNSVGMVPQVCWECDTMVRRALSFREQVKDCYRILQSYVENPQGGAFVDISRPPRLKMHTTCTVSIKPVDQQLSVKLEDKDSEKTDIAKISSIIDCIDKGPVEEIQTVMCDAKRDRRKKKNTLKTRSKLTRPKRSVKKDVDPVTVTDSGHNDVMKVEIEVDVKGVKTDERDVKMEFDDDVEDNLSNAGSLNFDSEIDTQIQSFLDDIKKNKRKSVKVKKKKKIEKKVSKPQYILTMDLSYDDMQTERSLLSRRESYARAQHKCASCLLVFNCATSLKTHQEKKHKVSGDYTCSICQTVLPSVEAFTQHYKRHMRRYECAICHKRATDVKSIEHHLYTRHQIALKEYKCKHCGKVSKSQERHRFHCDVHKSRVQCPQCDKTFSHRAGLMNHRLAVHEARDQFPCALCDKVFRWKTSLKRHAQKHNAEVEDQPQEARAETQRRGERCRQCDETFSHRAGLMNHRLAVHEARDQFPCALCDKVFRWKTSLKRHAQKHNAEQSAASSSNKAYCEECDIGFASMCSLQRHLRNSLRHVTYDQLKYICDHCGHRCVDKTKLRDHIEEKHLHRTFTCALCNKPSKNRVGLEQHIRSIHKGRPNNRICHHCGKGFPTKVQLESHIRTHTGERPFMCEYCPATFSQQSNLYKHHRKVHLNVKSKRDAPCKKSKLDGNRTCDPPPAFPITIMPFVPENGFSF